MVWGVFKLTRKRISNLKINAATKTLGAAETAASMVQACIGAAHSRSKFTGEI